MRKRRRSPGALAATWLALALLAVARPAEAGRPFVVEEVDLVGKKLVRLESWAVVTRDLLAHAALLGVGAGDFLEVKIGAVHGGVYGDGINGYGIRGPLLELDAMLLAPTLRGRPGFGFHVGGMTPLGYQTFEPPGWSAFGGLRVTQPLFHDRVRLHGNFGVSNGGRGEGIVRGQHVSSWLFGGVRLEALFSDRVAGLLEFFHRDPYGPYARWAAVQGGVRVRFNESVEAEAGLGLTLPYADGTDRVHVLGTVGVRLTTPVRW